MARFCPDLKEHQNGQQRQKDGRADQLAVGVCIIRRLAEPGHRDRVAAGFAERRRKDLDDPESKRVPALPSALW